MIEKNKIYNLDCLQGMQEIEPASVDAPPLFHVKQIFTNLLNYTRL